MHFDLSQCQQTAPNLYKCPGVDKSICGAFYSGQQVDYISLDKDGNVIVMKRYSSNAICRLTFADRIGKDLRALLYRSFLRRNSDFRFEIFRVDDIKLVRKLMRHCAFGTTALRRRMVQVTTVESIPSDFDALLKL